MSEELLPEAQVTRLIRQTLEGVQHLHQNQLVHLDLKVSHTHNQNQNMKRVQLSIQKISGFFGAILIF